MILPILTGALAAVIVFLPRFLHSKYPAFPWFSPVWFLAIGLMAIVLQILLQRQFRRVGSRSYCGAPDLFLHVHMPQGFYNVANWAVRGVISFFLTCLGGVAGSEGAAIEVVQAVNSRVHIRYSQWFEQRRRTDMAASLSAGVAAAFSAPFGGVFFPIELGIGGRSLTSVVSAFAAFLSIRFFVSLTHIPTLNLSGMLVGFHLSSWRQFVAICLIGVFAGITAVVFTYSARGVQNVLNQFRSSAVVSILVGAVLLAAFLSIVLMGKHPMDSVPNLFEQVLWFRHPPKEVLLFFFFQLLALVVLVSTIGTLGVLWPLFAIGSFLGFCINHWVLAGFVDLAAVAGLIGGAALCAAALGVPFTASIIVYEMTQDLDVMVPCLIAGLVAQQASKWFKTRNWIDLELQARGLVLISGRSHLVLQSVSVRDAMVKDFEVIQEQDLVFELKDKVQKSKYSFFPVVNSQGLLTGFLTSDVIERQLDQNALASLHSLSKLLEVKDLLYKEGQKFPTVNASDTLDLVSADVSDLPCVPVVGEDGKPVGILFSYSVRHIYEREVGRKSFSFFRDGKTSIS